MFISPRKRRIFKETLRQLEAQQAAATAPAPEDWNTTNALGIELPAWALNSTAVAVKDTPEPFEHR